ncbi:nmrA-like family domain-containing protein 1 [Convolutriloba macropyga]|uniref:nmrA-like family domain-containing protein 1 n=1 Tax=Convolutriloba macropyga TaxID=536237 RepID=UPI003F5266C8
MESVAVFTVSNEVGYRVALALTSKYKVRAVIPSDGDPVKIQTLESQGADVFKLDEFTPDSVGSVLRGCYSCFLATKTVFTEPNFQHNEIERGTLVVEQCKEAAICHLIHLTHVTVEFSIGILARQNDAKEYIEREIRRLELPSTGLILPMPYEALLNIHKPAKFAKNKYLLQIPMGETAFDGFSLDNVGDVVIGILSDGEKSFGKDYAVSSGKLTVDDMAYIMSTIITPVDFRDAKLTVNEMREMKEIAGCEDIGNMYEFMGRMDLRHNVDLTRRLCSLDGHKCSLLSFEQWVQKHADNIKQLL